MQAKGISGTYVHQAEAGRRFLVNCLPACAECAGCAAWVYKELPFQFICFEFVRSTPQQDIHIHLPCGNQESIRVPMRNNSMSMCEPYPKAAMLDDF